MCGEGGEYETIVFDSPLFKTHRIVEHEWEIIKHVDNDIAPVSYTRYHSLALEEKDQTLLEE